MRQRIRSEPFVLVLNPQHSKNKLQSRLSYGNQILSFGIEYSPWLPASQKKAHLHKAGEDLTHLFPKCESQSDFLLPTSNYNDVIRLEVPVIGLSSHHLFAVPTSRQFKVDGKGPGA